MNVQGAIVVPIIGSSREQQLERELADCYAQLEHKQVLLEEAHAQLAASGAPVLPDQSPMCVGGGLIGEADGWLWLMRGGVLRRLWPATAEETKQGQALRDQLEREQAGRAATRRRFAS